MKSPIAILALDPDTRLQVLFPLQRAGVSGQELASKGEKTSRSRKSPLLPKSGRNGAPALSDALKTRLFDLRKAGFNRLYQDGKIFEFSTPESLLDVNFADPVFVLVDRLTVSPDSRARVVDAIETAYRESGEVIFERPQAEETENLSGKSARATSGCASHSGLSAKPAISGMKSRSRGYFRSTTPTVPVRSARDSGIRLISISTSSSPTK